MPLASEPYVHGSNSILHHAVSNWLYPLGRVRPGTNVGALQAKLSVALRQWLATRPIYTDNGGAAEIPKQHVVIVPGGGGIQNLQQEAGESLTMLMILSSVVLLIACANIANLLLARATTRRADMAVRTALGAGRRRLIRQILTESILLSCIGGVAGLAVAYAGSRTILALAFPDSKNLPIDASPSLTVLGFAFLVSLVTGILFGTAPAWLSSQAQPAEALRGVNRSTRDRSSLPQKALVVMQAIYQQRTCRATAKPTAFTDLSAMGARNGVRPLPQFGFGPCARGLDPSQHLFDLGTRVLLDVPHGRVGSGRILNVDAVRVYRLGVSVNMRVGEEVLEHGACSAGAT
jgi:hypothetical protein